MGTKPTIKWYKNFVHVTSCIIIGSFLSGCIVTSTSRQLTASINARQKQYLNTCEKLIQKNNFEAAALDNDQLLIYYQSRLDRTDDVFINYIQQAKINHILLARIISYDDKNKSLLGKLQTSIENEQVKKTAINDLKLKTQKLLKRIENLEQEKHLLEEQIMRLKQIDLNTNKIPKETILEKTEAQ